MDEESMGAGVQRTEATGRLPAFWYEYNHVAHRLPDGSVEYIGFACRHNESTDCWPRVLS